MSDEEQRGPLHVFARIALALQERAERRRVKPEDHIMAIIEVPGDAPNVFEMRCECGWWGHTHYGFDAAEAACQRHWFQETGEVMDRRKDFRQ